MSFPIYVSEKCAKNMWQDYRVFPDRIELWSWALLSTFVIPLKDIIEIEVRPPVSVGDVFKGKVKILLALKLDWSDFCNHVAIHRKSGLFKYIRFTPDNPNNFVAACNSMRKRRA